MTRKQNNMHICKIQRREEPISILTVHKTNMYDALGTSLS